MSTVTRKLAISVVVILGLLLAPVSFAQRPEPAELRQQAQDRAATQGERRAQLEANQEQRQASREGQLAQACERVVAQIQTRIANYQDKKDSRVDRYQNMSDRVSELLDRLEETDVDTTQARSALAEFDVLITAFGESAEASLTELTLTQEYACGESEGVFKEQLQLARESFEELKETGQAVHQYYLESLRPALQALREQVRADQE